MAGEIAPSDTTIYVNGKKIVIKENNDKIKIKVYEQKAQGDTIENDQIFEGIYRDGKSTEKRMSNSINIPIPKLGS
jgi:septin family protein